MKDPLLQLREDMKADAVKALEKRGHFEAAGEVRNERERPRLIATVATNAMLKTIDAFRAKYEAVEAVNYGAVGMRCERWDKASDMACSDHLHIDTIIVPRKQQTLAEAAEALDAAIGGLASVGLGHDASAAWQRVHEARDVLTAALKREADNG